MIIEGEVKSFLASKSTSNFVLAGACEIVDALKRGMRVDYRDVHPDVMEYVRVLM